MSVNRLMLDAQVVCDFVASHPAESLREQSRIYLLVHGYEENGERVARGLAPTLPDGAAWIAPNGLYPLPRRRKPEDGGGYRLGFSWYFYDASLDDYYIDPSVAVAFLVALFARLKLDMVPTTVIGFSQGGYLAPFVAESLPGVDHVVGIGASFLSEEFTIRKGLRMDAIHGALDDRVDAGAARRFHEGAISKGALGTFSLLPQTAHIVDGAVQEVLRGLLGPGA